PGAGGEGEAIKPDPARYDTRTSVIRTGYVYDPIHRKLTYTFGGELADPNKQATGALKVLAPGRHEMELTVLDWKGNATTVRWSFMADPSLPKPEVIKRQQRQQAGLTPGGAGGQGAYGGRGGGGYGGGLGGGRGGFGGGYGGGLGGGRGGF